MTYRGKNKKRVTIISVYRTCILNDNQGVSTAHSQQWDILEERQREYENIRDKIINDLIDFVQSLLNSSHEIIVCIDTNEEFIPGKSGIAKLVESTNLTDPLINKFDIEGEPSTHQQRSYRIDFLLCTPGIETFILRISILPLREISPSDHRGIILDVHLQAFLNDLDHISSTSIRLLSTQSPDSSLIYKTNLIKYTITHNIINQLNNIQNKIDSKTLTSSDQPYLNQVDQLITEGMLFSEYKIKFSKFTHPWSPILAVAILSVSISSYTCHQ